MPQCHSAVTAATGGGQSSRLRDESRPSGRWLAREAATPRSQSLTPPPPDALSSTLPALMLLAGFAIAEVARRMRELPDMTRVRAWLLAGVVPALVVGDYLQLDVSYYQDQHGQRGRWREASQFVRDMAVEREAQGIRILTTNHPTMLYYLRQRHWFVGDTDPHPDRHVESVERWRFADGIDSNDNVLHEPGAENHLAWHIEAAGRDEQLFAVVVTMPELREPDFDGQLEAALRRDFELALYLPTWIGPKDQSIYVFLPKKGK